MSHAPDTMQRETVFDRRTGRELWKLTSWNASNCAATYFYLQCFSHDERYLVFCGDRDGVWRHYRLDLGTGDVMAVPNGITRPAGSRHWVEFHPNGREFIQPSDDGGIDAVDVETFEHRPLVLPPADTRVSVAGGLRFAHDNRLLVVAGRHEDGNACILLSDGEGVRCEEVLRWPDAERNFCHLLTPKTGPAICTFDVLPDHQNESDAPREERARNWKLDLTTGLAEPFLVMPVGERATHEYWSVIGPPRMYYHRKTVDGWVPASIDSVDLNGGDHRRHYESDTYKLGHSMMSPCGQYIVTDVQEPGNNPLILVNLSTGAEETLCWPDTSAIKNETGHVHPLFTPSGRHIAYTGDADGKAAVYLVPDVVSSSPTTLASSRTNA